MLSLIIVGVYVLISLTMSGIFVTSYLVNKYINE